MTAVETMFLHGYHMFAAVGETGLCTLSYPRLTRVPVEMTFDPCQRWWLSLNYVWAHDLAV